MPDTIRTLNDLNNNIFPDNTQGICSPQGIRDLVISGMVYGELGSGAKASINLSTTFQVLDFTLAGVVGRGLNIDIVNKRINGIPVVMKAHIDFELSFTGTVNTTYEASVFVNGVQNARLVDTTRIVSAAQIGKFQFSASIQLAENDAIDARIRSLSGTPVFVMSRGLLRVRRIGVE